MNTAKIAQINTSCGVGSTGKIAVSISELLTQNGIENEILFSTATNGYEKGIGFGKPGCWAIMDSIPRREPAKSSGNSSGSHPARCCCIISTDMIAIWKCCFPTLRTGRSSFSGRSMTVGRLQDIAHILHTQNVTAGKPDATIVRSGGGIAGSLIGVKPFIGKRSSYSLIWI